MKPLFPEPEGREARPAWESVPAVVVSRLEGLLGEKISGAETAWGGFSANADFIVRLASGRGVFLKGTHPGQDAHGAESLRREIRAYEAIPDIRDFSPAYVGCVDDGAGDSGWMLAAFEYIETIPTLPWTEEKIAAVFGLLARLHGISEIPRGLERAEERNFIRNFLAPAGGWLRIRDEPATAAKFMTLFHDAAEARDWLAAALPVLCGWQARAAETGGPRGVLHLDLRADNILFDRAGRAYLIDWNNACHGPAALDAAYFLSALAAESGIPATALLARYKMVFGAGIKEEDISIAPASISGYMADNAYRAAPGKLPRLRWMQKTLLWSMLQWAAALMGTAPPPRFAGMAP